MKSLFESKTFYVALFQGFAGLLMVIISQFPQLGWAMIVKTIIDVILRLLTDKPVTLL